LTLPHYQATNVRATDEGAAKGVSFKAGADPDEWIEQLSAPYRERPWAVIRELFQNASDAIVDQPRDEPRLVELALLDTNPSQKFDRYHLVIRDSGKGMTDDQFCSNVGILGAGSKKNSATTIGQFGVGFYSVQAICLAATLLSKSQESDQLCAWQYVPRFKTFYKLSPEQVAPLMASDFDGHLMASCRRSYGTSVYLNVDFENHPLCEEWLVAENLLRNVRRDFFVLPGRVHLGNYSTGNGPSPIYDVNKKNLANTPLNLEHAPWDLDGNEQREAGIHLLRALLPEVKDDHDLPQEWACFSRAEGMGHIAGMFYLVNGVSKGNLTVCLKRMWVEKPRDVMAEVVRPVFGVVNIQPSPTDFDVDVTPVRDRLLRDQHFDRARSAIQDESIAFLAEMSRRVVETIKSTLSGVADLRERVDNVRRIVSRSTMPSLMTELARNPSAILTDLPSLLKDVLKANDCSKIIVDYVSRLLGQHVAGGVTIAPADMPAVLDHLQEFANREAEKERRDIGIESLQWCPRVSTAFLRQLGAYLPVNVAFRERRREGGFNVITVVMPLAAIPQVDAGASHQVCVLLKGAPEDYFARNRQTSSVIVPSLPSMFKKDQEQVYVLLLAIVNSMSPSDCPALDFTELSKELFQDIAMVETWIPLVQCFDRIVNGDHQLPARFEVESKGYQGDAAIPLLITSDDTPRLVINAYNRLMQDLQSAYSSAAERNDAESISFLASMCHELYHHPFPADAESNEVDRHALDARNTVFQQALAFLRKYNDFKAKA
jgi:Histidine kinase-, DNA gyrase B-, and HSP90-like ATPase